MRRKSRRDIDADADMDRQVPPIGNATKRSAEEIAELKKRLTDQQSALSKKLQQMRAAMLQRSNGADAEKT